VLLVCVPQLSARQVSQSLSFIATVASLQFATEAAITILRIDDMIKLFKEDTGPPEGYDH